MSDDQIKLISLPKIVDLRGNLSFLEDNNQIPFEIARTYWIYDVPGGEERGGHAFRQSTELILPLSGGFTVDVTRGEHHSSYFLNKTNQGLLLPPMTWRKIKGFMSGSVCLIITNTQYSEKDYIRNFQHYFTDYQRGLYE